jgi:8-oxo-dGTP diphosphatase
MSDKRFTLPAAVFLILVKGDRVLLARRAYTGWHDGDFDLVAGHIDGGESLRTALVREAKEEIGVTIKPEDARFVQLMHGLFEDGKEYFNVFFAVDTWSGEPRIMEPDKCDHLAWFGLHDLPANLTESAKRGLAGVQDGAYYADFGFPVSRQSAGIPPGRPLVA